MKYGYTLVVLQLVQYISNVQLQVKQYEGHFKQFEFVVFK